MADLAEIMAGRGEPAPEPVVNEQTTQEPAQQPLQAQEPAPEPTAPTEPPPGYVPIQALDEANGKRRKYREELAEVRQQLARMQGFIESQQRQPAAPPQPPQPPPDIFENPNGFIDHHVNGALDQRITPMREALMFNARLTAEAIHKAETVQAATAAFDQAAAARQIDPTEYQRIMSSPNPFHEAVQWHKRTAALTEIGTDPAAYRERVRAELLAEIQAGQGAPQPPASPQAPQMPQSFAAARNAGPRSTPQWAGPKPLSELMGR